MNKTIILLEEFFLYLVKCPRRGVVAYTKGVLFWAEFDLWLKFCQQPKFLTKKYEIVNCNSCNCLATFCILFSGKDLSICTFSLHFVHMEPHYLPVLLGWNYLPIIVIFNLPVRSFKLLKRTCFQSNFDLVYMNVC